MSDGQSFRRSRMIPERRRQGAGPRRFPGGDAYATEGMTVRFESSHRTNDGRATSSHSPGTGRVDRDHHPVATLWDGQIPVQHFNIYLLTNDAPREAIDIPVRQDNSMIHAERNYLWLNTGLCYGGVPLTLNLLDAEADVPLHEWERVEEVSVEVTEPDGWYLSNDSEAHLPLGRIAAGTYRARFYGANVTAGQVLNIAVEGDTVPDYYRLDLWPSIAAAHAKLK